MRFVFLIFMAMLSNFTMAEEIIYRSYSPSIIKVDGANNVKFDSIVFSNDINEWMMVKGDAIIAMDSEGDASDWFHLKSAYFSFSFKKSWSKVPQRWVYRGIEYQSIGESKVQAFGVDVPVTIVSYSHPGQGRGYVYFSQQNGIVGFTSGEDTPVYLSSSNKRLMAR